MRIFLVEDEPILVMLLEDILEEFGYKTITATTFVEAMAMAPAVSADVALLDLDLDGQSSVPVAEVLHRRGIPLGFATGLGVAPELHVPLCNAPVISKPFSVEHLQELLITLAKENIIGLDQ